MKTLVTFEVDQLKLFDMLKRGGGGNPEALGSRLVMALLDPTNICASEALGMAVYGVIVTGVEGAPEEPAKT